MQNFTVERLSFQHLAELPAAWQPADYLALLTELNYDNPAGIAPAELKEMCQMALTDLEPAAAAQRVLEYLFAGQLAPGQIEQLAHQMQTEKLWEENPRLELHEGFFNAAQLLRLLAAGMSDRALLHRLFSEQVAGPAFAEAPFIL